MAIFKNITKQLTQIRIRQSAKITPSSSAIAEKIKSDSATGIISGLPWHSPMPNQLPVPMANKDWAT